MPESSIEIPSSITADEARLFLAMKLFEIGRLSCGQAAQLAGYSKRTFIELLSRHGTAVVDHAALELGDDLGHA